LALYMPMRSRIDAERASTAASIPNLQRVHDVAYSTVVSSPAG
jgi:hypothetical protein